MRYFVLCILLVLAGCSSSPKSRSSKYSMDTEKVFESIEKQQAVEKYRRMRQKDWNTYIKSKRQKTAPKPTPPSRRTYVQRRKQRPNLSEEQVRELRVEIDQNLSYYCMKNRKDKRFSSEADCQAYAQNTLAECEQTIGRPLHRGLLKCVKQRLRLR